VYLCAAGYPRRIGEGGQAHRLWLPHEVHSVAGGEFCTQSGVDYRDRGTDSGQRHKDEGREIDIAQALPALTANQRTYQIKNLIQQGMLLPINPGSRQYTIGFSNNYLVRGVIKALREQGFIPEPLDRP